MSLPTNKRKQDEKNLAILRDLGSQIANRICFDCKQKGPTYINMTIGSFVCTSCSGMLRGLNPPHRVKSISMASFTNEEIELLKSKGNEYCKAVWMAHYNENTNYYPESKDEQKLLELMISKYEKKRYYAEQEIALKNIENREKKMHVETKSNQSNGKIEPSKSAFKLPAHNSSTSPINLNKPTTNGLSSSLGKSSFMGFPSGTSIKLPNNTDWGTSIKTPSNTDWETSIKSPSNTDWGTSIKPPINTDWGTSIKPPSNTDWGTSIKPPNNTDWNKAFEPFSSQTTENATKDNNFANFDNANIFSSSQNPAVKSISVPFSLSSNPLTPFSPSLNVLSSISTTPTGSKANEDRYAALKDLDEAFKFKKEVSKENKADSNYIQQTSGPATQKLAQTSAGGWANFDANNFQNMDANSTNPWASANSNPFVSSQAPPTSQSFNPFL